MKAVLIFVTFRCPSAKEPDKCSANGHHHQASCADYEHSLSLGPNFPDLSVFFQRPFRSVAIAFARRARSAREPPGRKHV